jgi:hypothetical protein
MSSRLRALALSFTLLATFGGCRCGTSVSTRVPEMRVDGRALDFGSVIAGRPHTRPFRVRNLGNGPLTLSSLTTAAPFSVTQQAPLTVEPGTELSLEVVFTPEQVGVRAQGELVIESDDPSERRLVVALSGTGVEAVLQAMPTALEFGEVYVGASKSLTLTLRNGGNAELTVESAEWAPGTPAAPVVTADLSSLERRIAAGASISADITFSPAEPGALSGGLRLVLGGGGPETVVSLGGAGVKATPQLCFQAAGSGMASCTPVDASPGTQLLVPLPATCDNRLFPPGHLDACTGELPPRPGVRKGRLFVRNAGNTSVRYSLRFNRMMGNRNPCGLAAAPAPDFAFSGAPVAADGGVEVEWSTPSVELAGGEDSPDVEVTYTASSRCAQDAAEQAQVLYTKQGTQPSVDGLMVTFSGTSLLPRAVASSLTIQGTVPIQADFRGAANRGGAPFNVTAVNLFELPTDGGAPIACDPSSPTYGSSDCSRFTWASGGDPNANVPITVPASPDPSMEVVVTVGRLIFGESGQAVAFDGGVDPTGKPELNKPYRLRAVVNTTDPYNPQVASDIQATAR